MEPKEKLNTGTELLSNNLMSELLGQDMDEGKDQWVQFSIREGVLFGLISHKDTGETLAFVRIPAKNTAVECHMADSKKPAYVVMIGGTVSPFVFPAEKMNAFMEACLTIQN